MTDIRENSGNPGRVVLLGIVVIAVVATFSYQYMDTAKVKDRLVEIEGSLQDTENTVMALSSNMTSLATSINLVGRNTSEALAQVGGKLGDLEASLASVHAEVSAIIEESPGNLKEWIQSLLNRTTILESTIDGLDDQVDDINQTLAALRVIEDTYDSLNMTISDALSEVESLKEVVEGLISATPGNIYEDSRNSVVLIRTNLGQGSGFFFGPDLILTNYHVIKGATNIEVEYYDRQRAKASLVGGDAYSDVAVIRVPSHPDITPLSLANSSQVWIGQQVVAIGNPLGLTGSLSSGYVAQVNKLVDIEPIKVPVLELDITIAPGSSGGPLFDLSGKVVGITNAGTGYGLNFAVPSNIVNRAAASIIQKGSYEHPFVGVKLIELTPETIRATNIINIDPFQTGLMVTDVIPGTPAQEAGLEPAVSTTTGSAGYEARDIILAIDGHPTLTFEDWAAYVEEKISPGQTMLLEVWRSGTIINIPVTPTSRPPYPD